MIRINDVIEASKQYWKDEISLIKLDEIYKEYESCSDIYKKTNAVRLCKELTGIIFSGNEVKNFYYMMSAMFKMTMIPEVFYELIRACIDDAELTKENKHFIYSQLASDRFLYPVVNTVETRDLLDDLYDVVYLEYLKELKDYCIPIPCKERNTDFVIVITSQVLSLNHGPTKTLLDRCSILSDAMKKKVFIINTNSVLPEYGEVPWFNQRIGNYVEDFNKLEYLEWKGKKFSFFQCPREMPRTDIIKEILQILKSEKPYFIVSIGSEDITADICSRVIPSLTVTLGPSERAQTRTTFQMTGHMIDDEDREWLRKHGLDTTHIIEGIFTSDFKPQVSVSTREELGLPVRGFICIVVGYRLDEEIDEAFLDVIRELARNHIYLAVMGNFDSYEEIVRDDELLREYMINLGFKSDALAVYECCNAYINPKRLGGGTSAAEALSKGLPVVTVKYGDVAIGVGNDFTVEDYSEMKDRILKLSTDKNYYESMSRKAKERAEILTDSRGEFIRIIKEMESRKEFF